MSAKLGFTAGLAVGLLAGSRAGRGLYDRSAAAASAVVQDPRVRRGASSALHRVGSTGSTVAGAAARKITHRGDGRRDAGGAAAGSSGNGTESEHAGAKGSGSTGSRGSKGAMGAEGVGSDLHRTHRFSMAGVHGPDGFHGFHGFNGMSGVGGPGWGRRGSANGHGLGTGDSGTSGTAGGGEKGDLGDGDKDGDGEGERPHLAGATETTGAEKGLRGLRGMMGRRGQELGGSAIGAGAGQDSGAMSGFRSRHRAVSAPSVQAKPRDWGRPEGPAQSGSN